MTPSEGSIFGFAKRYERYAGLAAVLVVAIFILNTLFRTSNGAAGIAPGHRVPPFAVPLALSSVNGDANVATHPNDGSLGRRPACTVRGVELLNICELYEHAPLVLALFIDEGSCAGILDDLQKLAPSFPHVRFAGVAIKGSRSELRALVRSHHLTLPVGYDHDGVLASLYAMASCPQVTFTYPGGIVQSRALLTRPSLSTLSSRIGALEAAARARGWRPG
jgi:hypothetical protein